MLLLFGVLFITIAVSFLHEIWLKPVAPKLTSKTILLQGLLVTVVYLVISLVVQRPIFSALTVLIFLIILVAVSNAKFKALREPMVFSDMAMFAQAFKHPRLYFPFLGLAPVIIAPLFIIALIIFVLSLEPALPLTLIRIITSLILIAVALLASKKIALSINLTQDPEIDNATLGLQNSLFTYAIHSRTKKHHQRIEKTIQSAPFSLQQNRINESSSAEHSRSTPPLFFNVFSQMRASKQPNITVVQSESFFDARRLHPAIKQDVLKNFDRINAESNQHGKLKVPAWGANTMRSEFAFLTGIKQQGLGLIRFYPYQFLKNTRTHSIASFLQQQGYYTVCIHPHHASFFGRDKMFPQMGFDEFIDIGSFEGAEEFGPYIADSAVTDRIIEVTEATTDKPLFIFVITMENHGPLYLEKTSQDEIKDYYHGDIPNTNLNDLTVYLRHLKNADQMIKRLTDFYRQSDQETSLCFYGDHVPSMPDIYEELGYQDNNSDYFIWQSTRNKPNTEKQAKIQNIDSLAIDLCNVIVKEYC